MNVRCPANTYVRSPESGRDRVWRFGGVRARGPPNRSFLVVGSCRDPLKKGGPPEGGIDVEEFVLARHGRAGPYQANERPFPLTRSAASRKSRPP